MGRKRSPDHLSIWVSLQINSLKVILLALFHQHYIFKALREPISGLGMNGHYVIRVDLLDSPKWCPRLMHGRGHGNASHSPDSPLVQRETIGFDIEAVVKRSRSARNMQLSHSENANSFGCRRMICSCYWFKDALYGKYVPAFNILKNWGMSLRVMQTG